MQLPPKYKTPVKGFDLSNPPSHPGGNAPPHLNRGRTKMTKFDMDPKDFFGIFLGGKNLSKFGGGVTGTPGVGSDLLGLLSEHVTPQPADLFF